MMGTNPIGGFFSGGLFGSASSPSSSPRAGESQEEHDDDVADVEQESPRESQSSGWNFGSFMKTIAEKSNISANLTGVLQTYQQDLKEFGIGLKKETAAITGVTAHVVKDLPTSIETGATVAQESLETVGQTLEDFGSSVWRGTSEIFAHVKEAVLTVDEDTVGGSNVESHSSLGDSSSSLSNTKFNRFEAQVNAMQRNTGTYCDEPEDEKDFVAWVAGFNLDDRSEEIEEILSKNAFMQELHSRMVPVVVEHSTFWTRYFYRLNKLQQIENARANLVKRATDAEEEEDLSWDVDEENEDEKEDEKKVEELEKHVAPSEIVTEVAKSAEALTSTRSVDVPVVASVVETLDEEEAKSEASAGSEWLVVSEGKGSGSSEPKTSPSSPISDRHEAGSSVPTKSEEHEVDEAELDQLGDLSMDDDTEVVPVKAKKGEEKVSTPKSTGGEDNEEDWGEWE